MPVDFNCPQCQRPYHVSDDAAGKRFKCKQCANVLTVPGAATPQPGPQAALHARGPAPRLAPRPMAPALQGQAPAPFGVAQDARGGTGPRGVNYVFLVGAAMLLLGFFLPWLDVVIFSISGFQIPIKMNQLAKVMGDESGKFAVLYFLYFIPVSCLAGAIEEFLGAKQGKNRWYARLIVALSPLIAFVLIIVTFPSPEGPAGAQEETSSQRPDRQTPSVFSFLGIGAYLSVAGFVVSLASVFINPKRRMNAMLPMRPRRVPMPGAIPQLAQAGLPQAPRLPVPGVKAKPRLPGPRPPSSA